jgi:hypothetical protein
MTGEVNWYFMLIGAMLVVVIIFGTEYYNNHKNDVTIHPPHVVVH